jgi:hypothetical protein
VKAVESAFPSPTAIVTVIQSRLSDAHNIPFVRYHGHSLSRNLVDEHRFLTFRIAAQGPRILSICAEMVGERPGANSRGRGGKFKKFTRGGK